VAWSDTSGTATCAGYPSALVGMPGGTAGEFPLTPQAQVCDGSPPVVHPLTAS
jgi:hypothetical protein